MFAPGSSVYCDMPLACINGLAKCGVIPTPLTPGTQTIASRPPVFFHRLEDSRFPNLTQETLDTTGTSNAIKPVASKDAFDPNNAKSHGTDGNLTSNMAEQLDGVGQKEEEWEKPDLIQVDKVDFRKKLDDYKRRKKTKGSGDTSDDKDYKSDDGDDDDEDYDDDHDGDDDDDNEDDDDDHDDGKDANPNEDVGLKASGKGKKRKAPKNWENYERMFKFTIKN